MERLYFWRLTLPVRSVAFDVDLDVDRDVDLDVDRDVDLDFDSDRDLSLTASMQHDHELPSC